MLASQDLTDATSECLLPGILRKCFFFHKENLKINRKQKNSQDILLNRHSVCVCVYVCVCTCVYGCVYAFKR